jgi:hypothetical protein
VLFKAIHDGIKSGVLSFNYSYRFRFVEDYLIPKEEWEARKEQLLADAEMSDLSDCTTLLEGMESNLDQLYHQVNDNYNLGLNPHLSFDKNDKPIVHTPEVEKFDISRIDANNAIIKIKNELSLPEVHRKSPDELHTASDGQKVLSQKKSLNATFSYKYRQRPTVRLYQSSSGQYRH